MELIICVLLRYNNMRKREDLTFMEHVLCARPPSECVLCVLTHVILQQAYKTGVSTHTPALHLQMSNVRH